MPVCCQQRVHGEFIELPFKRVLATDYYDGPLEGFAECCHCGAAYHFEMLDWDDSQDTRIFRFAPLATTLDAIAQRAGCDQDNTSQVEILSCNGSDLDYLQELIQSSAAKVTAFQGWPGSSDIWLDLASFPATEPVDWIVRLGISVQRRTPPYPPPPQVAP